MSYFKKRLMFCVAGLDRGFAANDAAVKDVEAAIYSLVGAAGGAPTLSYAPSTGGASYTPMPWVLLRNSWDVL